MKKRLYLVILVILLLFLPKPAYTSNRLKIEPSIIDFGFVPLDRNMIQDVVLTNLSDQKISNISINIPDSLSEYYRCEKDPPFIEGMDSTTVYLSFYCSEMFVTCEGSIFIKYIIGEKSFTDIIEVHGEPAMERGWNWISIPKLNRSSNKGYEISALLKPLEPYARTVLCEGGVMECIEYTWSHMGLYYYDDTSFIKLRMLGGNEEVYPFELKEDSLSFLPANTSFDLNKGYNWIGYWLPGSQDLQTAFGIHWDEVHAIKAERWFYINQRFYTEDYSIILDLPANQNHKLHYGRGYVVIMKEQVKGFKWNVSANNRILEQQYKNPSFITFKEKSNYEVVDVIGIPESAEEVGAFDNDDICIGAGLVNEHHTAQILIYPRSTRNDSGEISIKLKCRGITDPQPSAYLLFNNTTKKFVDKKLYVNTQVYNIIKMCNEQ